MNLIGLSGKAGAGKSTVAKILVEQHRYVEVALADAMKRALREWFQFTDDQLWGPSSARNAPDFRFPRDVGGMLSPREALQALGTEFGRRCYEDVWINYTIRIAECVLSPGYNGRYRRTIGLDQSWGLGSNAKGVVISDVRFPNEFAKIKSVGKMWRIDRPVAKLTAGIQNHSSEVSLDEVGDEEFDRVIANHAGIERLPELVEMALSGEIQVCA
jgi:hypothetical protein